MGAREESATADEIRIATGKARERMARGWHCIGLAAPYQDGKPHALKAFGLQLVVFQTASGVMSVLDSHCPHLGGDLSEGTVKGEAVACPFHDWRWGPNGRCVGIPYAKRIPARARMRSWHVMEENKLLFVWHDPEGQPPPPEVTIPRIDGLFDGTWTDWDLSVHDLQVEGRELVDNIVDVAHFFYIHGEGRGGGASYFKNAFEGHTAWQFLEIGGDPHAPHGYDKGAAGIEPERIESTSRGETRYYGPAYLHSRLMFRTPQDTGEFIEILAQVPVSPTSFRLCMGFTVKKRADLTEEQNAQRAAAIAHQARVGTLQDVHIWETKARIDNPLLCDTDGPIYQLRRWYEQFFVDVADVQPDMIARVEVETDTRHALPVWDGQAAEKIGAGVTAAKP